MGNRYLYRGADPGRRRDIEPTTMVARKLIDERKAEPAARDVLNRV